MTNVTSDYWVDNFRYKFRFEGNNGNNFYLDDINIYPSAPSSDIVLGVENVGSIEEINLFPNPAENQINLHYSVQEPSDAYVQLIDLTGKVVQQHKIKSSVGSNLVLLDTQEVAAGSYQVVLFAAGTRKVLSCVIK
jgi:Tol biopolymer transport system component